MQGKRLPWGLSPPVERASPQLTFLSHLRDGGGVVTAPDTGPPPRWDVLIRSQKLPLPTPHTTPTGLQCLTVDSSQKRGKTRITTMEFLGNPQREKWGTWKSLTPHQQQTGNSPSQVNTQPHTQAWPHQSLSPNTRPAFYKRITRQLKGHGGKRSNDVTAASDPVTTQEGNLK